MATLYDFSRSAVLGSLIYTGAMLVDRALNTYTPISTRIYTPTTTVEAVLGLCLVALSWGITGVVRGWS